MNQLTDQILQALPFSLPQRDDKWSDFLPPVEGKMGDGFTARRAHGQHNGGDIHAAPGTPVVAPRDMVYLYGGKGGTNLRNNDYWAHFKDPETGKEYRFVHMSGVPKLNPGDVVKQGEQWSTVGNVVDNPHIHMSVYNPKEGQSEDWPSALGLTQGRVTIASNPQLERRIASVASTIPQQSEPRGESIAFEKGGRSYMDPSMLAAGGFGASIPGLDIGNLSEGISQGRDTQQSFLGQVLEALGSYGKKDGGLGGTIGGMAGGAAVGAGVGELAGDVVKLLMLNKADKMARQHAGWLQNIAANPPRPDWARGMSGPGLNT
jgi:hypothetical protein